jgi:hypothetical protein
MGCIKAGLAQDKATFHRKRVDEPRLLGSLLYFRTCPVTETEGENLSCQVMPGAFNLFDKTYYLRKGFHIRTGFE